jgi:hypothetical protein
MKHFTQDNGNLTDDVLSQALRSLPSRLPPAGLRTSLLVAASRERQHLIESRTFGSRWGVLRSQFSLILNNFMRPMALPFAGGVFSAVVLFSMLVVPTYPVRASSGADIPTMLTTEAFVKGTAPVGAASGEIVVDVSVDDQGKMVDYRIVSGQALLKDYTLRRRLENMLLFTQFAPATSFGVPTAARMRLSLHALSYIDVKG